MSWSIQYLPEAKADLQKLDPSVRLEAVKGIRKVSQKPGADGYGKPLGHIHASNLSGLFKIKFKRSGLRVVYALQHKDEAMCIIVIAARADGAVYREAGKRLRRHP